MLGSSRRLRGIAAHVVPHDYGVAVGETSSPSLVMDDAVPVVDVSPFLGYQQGDRSGDDDKDIAAAQAVVRAIGSACRDVGFVVVTGHGIDPSLTKNAADEAAAFFRQPEGAKLAVAARGGAFGYIPLNSEALGDDGDATLRPDLRETFAMGPVDSLRPAELNPASLSAHDREVFEFCYQPTPWPNASASDSSAPGLAAGLRPAMEELYLATARLGDGLLQIFGRALGIDEALLLSKTTHHFSAMAAINYPPLARDQLRPGQLRCGPHQDSGTLTIVWENAEGLEVLPRGKTTWQSVRSASFFVSDSTCFCCTRVPLTVKFTRIPGPPSNCR